MTTTTALGTASSLVSDSSTTGNVTTYTPIGIWASNYTYGISLSLKAVGTSATTYTIANFYNGSTTGYLSGIELSSAVGAAAGVWGWQLNTGYSLAAKWPSSTTSAYTFTYTYGQFLSNATANTTSTIVATLASALYGPVTVFEDANGELWLGWTDATISSATPPVPSTTYAGYLAGLQGQLNPSSSTFANALKGIMAFVAFCLAAVFAF
jgi:hypothetical protein